MTSRESTEDERLEWSYEAVVAPLLGWLLPGAGHLYLGRRERAAAFFLIVLAAVVVGTQLDGNLYRIEPNRPLTVLGTFACAGMGLPYVVLRFLLSYSGDIVARGYEYGTAFLLTAGLMNWLLVLDCWDIAIGRKE
ncbi:MAG: DUF6677 family protein [Thermoanaerobaculia bacterium]|nr:DUF6677 family protein [Thermoanaerobaculia bacterium]